jgi:hypothetical protein
MGADGAVEAAIIRGYGTTLAEMQISTVFGILAAIIFAVRAAEFPQPVEWWEPVPGSTVS